MFNDWIIILYGLLFLEIFFVSIIEVIKYQKDKNDFEFRSILWELYFSSAKKQIQTNNYLHSKRQN